MSYDILLFRLKPGQSPREALEQMEREIVDETSLQISDPEKHSSDRQVAAMLMAHNPRLELFQSPDGHLELSTVGGNGIEINLFEAEAAVTVPYWHRGDAATSVFREIWQCLEIVQRETGYTVFDPQLDRILDLNSPDDFASVLYVNELTNEKIDELKNDIGAEHGGL